MDAFSLMVGFGVGVAVGAVLFSILHPNAPSFNNSGKTIVELRDTSGVNARRWTTSVHYDSWGAPYVKEGSYGSIGAALYQDGRTSDHFVRGTEWKRISGPPVQFGRRPEHAFGPGYDPNVIEADMQKRSPL